MLSSRSAAHALISTMQSNAFATPHLKHVCFGHNSVRNLSGILSVASRMSLANFIISVLGSSR
jgi:hypothetical protein